MTFTFRTFSLFLLTLFLSGAAFAQGSGEIFNDPDGKYTVKLPPGWHSVVNRDAVTNKAEVHIVFNVRENGSLRFRVLNVDAKADTLEEAKKDEQQTLRFQPGYDNGKAENFIVGGNAPNGALVSFDYTTVNGQPMAGRNYYLRVNDMTIYVLRFTGRRNILPSLRNQTDAMARSFKIK